MREFVRASLRSEGNPLPQSFVRVGMAATCLAYLPLKRDFRMGWMGGPTVEEVPRIMARDAHHTR
jgi:hypothetical protein